ncbi:unnamed protein product [Brassicogethes aeneus]|uniref:carnosine N-methyltransferase n=1 Tax=Brassicogethes aeneus TaxID=1431903 RepID=A0A9P0B055_BRAAE|nr:unnamed protein product [Brassicogethes aeneus]
MNNAMNGAKEERDYFLSVLSTFKNYRERSLNYINYKEKCIESLPHNHKELLEKYKEDLNTYKKCVEKNAELIPLVLQHAHKIFDNFYSNDEGEQPEKIGSLSDDRVQVVFKQLMRDWSDLGANERKQCYDPIIEEILENYPEDINARGHFNILVPGAGLGRLAFEIASRGFSCQGNEFNLFMLVVSYYVLNLCTDVDQYEIYPWIHQYCNYLKPDGQMTSVKFPDIKPSPTPDSKFSMTAGDFLEVYMDSDEWHCVATCFFIDCAPNVVQFVERIYMILKPGGLWVNLGPLMYHYSGIHNEKSVEPSFERLCEIIKKIGFVMEKCKTGLKTKYCQNPQSMLQYEYDSVFFVCRKPIEVKPEESMT